MTRDEVEQAIKALNRHPAPFCLACKGGGIIKSKKDGSYWPCVCLIDYPNYMYDEQKELEK